MFLRTSKRRRVSRDGPSSTNTASENTVTNLGVTDIFNVTSTTAYRNWLQAVQSTAATQEFGAFVDENVAAHADGVWTTGKVQCLHQGFTSSMTRTLPTDTLLPNKSQPFSIVWADNTDSICDLPSMLTFLDNFKSKRHRTNATSSSPATNRSVRTASNVSAAPSSLPSSSSLPRPPLPPHDAPATAPAHTVGIFTVIPSRPGDLVDSLTRSGSFAFLSELFDTERLFELRDFLIARVTPKGEAIEQFAASMHLVLDLADKYPRDSLDAHILGFQRGDWRGLWETALRFARKEIDSNNKRKHNHAKRDTSSLQSRVVYAEHFARKGDLSKANQAITSTSMPNADPTNIDLLRVHRSSSSQASRDRSS
jgi:hypothetical protein